MNFIATSSPSASTRLMTPSPSLAADGPLAFDTYPSPAAA
jgi:hypothetical protein